MSADRKPNQKWCGPETEVRAMLLIPKLFLDIVKSGVTISSLWAGDI